MPISDNKKVQTLINLGGVEIERMRQLLDKIRESRTVLINVRNLFAAQDPPVDRTGTPLEGDALATLDMALSTLNTALLTSTVDEALSNPVFDAFIAAIVPTHRGTALD